MLAVVLLDGARPRRSCPTSFVHGAGRLDSPKAFWSGVDERFGDLDVAQTDLPSERLCSASGTGQAGPIEPLAKARTGH